MISAPPGFALPFMLTGGGLDTDGAGAAGAAWAAGTGAGFFADFFCAISSTNVTVEYS